MLISAATKPVLNHPQTNLVGRLNRCLPLLLLWLAVPETPAESLLVEPAKDTSIFEESGNSNGQGISLFAGTTKGEQGTGERRALLMFDLDGRLPTGAIIQSVTLRLHVSQIPQGDAGDYEFRIHRLTSNWGEGSSDAGAVGGRGTVAEPGDSTWTQALFPTTAWSSPGGDFQAVPSATEILSGRGVYTWNSDGLLEDVRFWLVEPTKNFGWIIIGPKFQGSARRFDSRHLPDARFRPLLVIDYITNWAGYPLDGDGRSVNTFGFLGWLDVANAPWIYAYSIKQYIYVPTGSVTQAGAWIWSGP